MWVANLIEHCKEDRDCDPVYKFFEATDEAAELGSLSTTTSKVEIVRVSKIMLFHPTRVEGDDIKYMDFKAVFIRRFNDK
jgi:hypothetical protein